MDKDKRLKLLAIAIADNPRRTTKELAEAIGISKATFHRCYGTRENLMNILIEKSNEYLENIIKVSEAPYDDFKEGVRALINAYYDNKEYLIFICGTQICDKDSECTKYYKAIDSFFLRGQKEGFFKIDISIHALTEIFISNIFSMIDAERRGRIATNNILDVIENMFLYGAIN